MSQPDTTLGQISGNVEVRPIGKFLVAGLILFALAWLWSAVTSYSLMREAATDKQRSLENFGAPPVQKLSDAKTPAALVAPVC